MHHWRMYKYFSSTEYALSMCIRRNLCQRNSYPLPYTEEQFDDIHFYENHKCIHGP